MFRRMVLIILLGLLACSCAQAEEEKEKKEKKEKKKISVTLSYGVFLPSDSETRDRFDDSFPRLSLTTFDPEKPRSWRFTMEGGSYKLAGENENVRLYPVSFGFEKGLKGSSSIQPYMALRTGPYFGKMTRNDGNTERHTGTNFNAAYGVVIDKRYYAEIRYDMFSEFGGSNFDGLSLSAGVRLFDIKL